MLMLLWSVHQSRLPHIIVWFPRPDVKMFYKEPFLPTNTSYSAKPTQIHIFFCINLRTSKCTDIAGLCHGPSSLLLASNLVQCHDSLFEICDKKNDSAGRTFKYVWGYNTKGPSVTPLCH